MSRERSNGEWTGHGAGDVGFLREIATSNGGEAPSGRASARFTFSDGSAGPRITISEDEWSKAQRVAHQLTHRRGDTDDVEFLIAMMLCALDALSERGITLVPTGKPDSFTVGIFDHGPHARN